MSGYLHSPSSLVSSPQPSLSSNNGSNDGSKEVKAEFQTNEDPGAAIQSQTPDTTTTGNQDSEVDVHKAPDDVESSDGEFVDSGKQDTGTQTYHCALKSSLDDIYELKKRYETQGLALKEQLNRMGSMLALLEGRIREIVNSQTVQKGQINVEGNPTLILEKAITDIHVLKSRVEDFEVAVLDLSGEVYSAHHKIKIHERVIRKLLGPENDNLFEQYDGNSELDDDKLNQAVEPQTDSCA